MWRLSRGGEGGGGGRLGGEGECGLGAAFSGGCGCGYELVEWVVVRWRRGLGGSAKKGKEGCALGKLVSVDFFTT